MTDSSFFSPLPWQLQRDDLLFVLIPKGEKGPRSPGWNRTDMGLRGQDPRLYQHIRDGGNYGYYPAPGSLLLSLDVDDADSFHLAGGEDLVRNTYRYSAWPDRHKYRAIVTCPDIPLEWQGRKTSIMGDRKIPIFELFFPSNIEKTGGQCVGPGSIHPNGNQYASIDPDAAILSVSWVDIWNVVQTLSPATVPKTIPDSIIKVRSPGISKTLAERYGLSVRDHHPDNSRICGDEVRGSHPIHGSSTGENVALNPGKGIFYCFRCQRGGDAAIWDAINRGIIRCDESYDHEALKRHAEILDHERPDVRFLERIEWKRNKQKWGKR
ncbi:MAG TPA: hypothetical protein VN372_06000 [Methanospirillum sp.]|nr:hypothetical protein [Methanospirillum sp.]